MKRRWDSVLSAHWERLSVEVEESGWRVVALCMWTSLVTMMPVGYHMVALNVPEKVMQNAVNASWLHVFASPIEPKALIVLWSITVASQSVGAILGCTFVVCFSRRLGTKTLLMTVNSYVLLAASFIFAIAFVADAFLFLPLGRLLAGVYTGISIAMLPLYIQEIAPQQIKGALSCFIHIAICLGSAMSAVLSLDFILGGEDTWWIFLSIPALFGALQIFSAYKFIPETPNHLIRSGQFAKAVQSISFYYDIWREDGDEAIKLYWERVPQMPPQLPFKAVLADRGLRWKTMLGMVVSATQVFSGSMVTISFSTTMFTSVSFLSSLVPYLPSLGSLLSIFLTLPALQLVESLGRRPLLLSTLLICLISNFCFLFFSLLSVNPEDWWASWLFGLSFILYGFGYNLGTGPVSYFVPAELVPAEAATVALGAAVGVNWLSALATTFLYYPLNAWIGGWSYMLFILPTSLFLLFLFQFLPETKEFAQTQEQSTILRELDGFVERNIYGTFGDNTGAENSAH